jgi:hypothetical protein
VTRKLFGLATALSLVLCLATVGLWVRSYQEMYQWEWTTSRGLEDPAWRHGQLCVAMGRVGYVARAADGIPNERFFKSTRRFRLMNHGQFAQSHPFQFDPWGSGTVVRPAPINEKIYWWRGVQYSWTHWSFGRDHTTQRQAWLPLWLLSVLLLVLPLFRAIGWLRRHRRNRHQQCVSCGYDLTANTSGACPECGTRTDSGVGIRA